MGDTWADLERGIQPLHGAVRIESTKSDRPARTEPPYGLPGFGEPRSFTLKFVDERDIKTAPQSLRRDTSVMPVHGNDSTIANGVVNDRINDCAGFRG